MAATCAVLGDGQAKPSCESSLAAASTEPGDTEQEVPKVLLEFIELLSQHNYLSLPEANSIIYYIAQLSEPDPTVPLPKLITLACYPSNISAIVPLSKAATEKALKVLSLGEVPNLSDFHHMPTQVILSQRLLTQLVVFSQEPYTVKELGASSLRLLHSLHPVIHSNVGHLWNQAIPQLLKILEDHSEENLSQNEWEDRLLQFLNQSLVAINDDDWLQQLIRVLLKMITYFSNHGDGDGDEKAFLYKFYGFSLWTARNEQVIKMMLSALLQTSHEELREREVMQSVLAKGEPFQFERQAGWQGG
ncbi:maestro heat-like repeat-containing protein family member 1 [Desmodus rotundus]|uniref:maestro heat-like repeat-containing protein family member 1 n=1 Tax=Desmodus rotundus TaxID=9430 RepID=UPI00238135EF|nr:maestro heat-like repeat-containing protein family member 1 [Desmodus rotundus]